MKRAIFAMVASAIALAAEAYAGQGQSGASAAEAPPTTITYSDKGPNGMTDLPMGVHRVPDTNVLISGHQKGGLLGMVLFGVPGMLVQSAANAASGRGAVGNTQDQLRFDVTAKAAEMTQTIIAADAYRQHYTLSPGANGGTLSVVPYVVITFVNKTDVRPFVVLKTKFSSGPGQPSQTVKYFCCEGKPAPLSGENGLTENAGQPLKDLLSSELQTAINVMLLDRSHAYPRDNLAKSTISGSFPFVGKSMKIKGYDIGQYQDYMLFQTSGGVFGGVHIADRSSLEIEARKSN